MEDSWSFSQSPLVNSLLQFYNLKLLEVYCSTLMCIDIPKIDN